jgi:RNA polymerase sigma-70 factor, ECF subfamily
MDLKQFKIEVLPLRNKLYGYARKWVCDSNDAEDAVQEVMIKLWNKRQTLDDYRSIEAFAMTLTHHTCIDMGRVKKTNVLSIDDIQLAETFSSEDQSELKNEVELIHHIINSLPGVQRTTIKMKDVEGYETEEIAEIIGCGVEAVRSNLSRARKKVRDVYLQIIKESSKDERNKCKKIIR